MYIHTMPDKKEKSETGLSPRSILKKKLCTNTNYVVKEPNDKELSAEAQQDAFMSYNAKILAIRNRSSSHFFKDHQQHHAPQAGAARKSRVKFSSLVTEYDTASDETGKSKDITKFAIQIHYVSDNQKEVDFLYDLARFIVKHPMMLAQADLNKILKVAEKKGVSFDDLGMKNDKLLHFVTGITELLDSLSTLLNLPKYEHSFVPLEATSSSESAGSNKSISSPQRPLTPTPEPKSPSKATQSPSSSVASDKRNSPEAPLIPTPPVASKSSSFTRR